MRRALVLSLLASLSLGCAATGAEKGFRDFPVDPAPALAASASSPEIDALVARFYGSAGTEDLSSAIDAALARAKESGALHEIAAYQAILRADPHLAFEHFVRAAADTNAVAPELYLWEMLSLAQTATEHRQAEALLREIRDQHPRPFIRQLAADGLAGELRLFAQREEAQAIIRSLGFIEPWMILGAFDNDQGKGFSAEYPPEQSGTDRGEYMGARMPIRFRPVNINPLDGALPLGDAIAPAESAVAYAQTYVWADRAEDVELRITTTDAVRAWLNGHLVASDDHISRDELDNLAVAVTLQQGWNRLFIKSANRTGAWRLAARFTAKDGAPRILRAAATAPASFPIVAGPAKEAISTTTAIDRLTDDNRKRFLLGRHWTRQGHPHRASWFLEPLLRDAPDNPLVVLFAAVAFWDNSETGKALDLLTRGAASFPRAPAFLVKRARFYAQRGLWDKAQKDLTAALSENPRAREAELDLAAAYAARGWPIDRCRELSAVLERWPDSSQAHAERSACEQDQGYLRRAEDDLRAAIALAPGSPWILDRLLRLERRQGKDDSALATVRALRAAAPTSLGAMLDEADLLRSIGRPAEAKAILEAASARSPDAPTPYERMAAIAYEAGRRADAISDYRRAAERDPDNAALAERVAYLSPDAPALGERLAASVDDIERAVRSASHVKVHPGSHVVTLLQDEVVTINPDGSSKRIVTHVDLAANTEGRDALIQARLPSFGRVKVLEAYSIKKDGERQEASSIASGTIRFRSLDVGSITVARYAHYAPAPRFLPNEYVGQWAFQGTSRQIEEARVRLILGNGRALNVKTRGDIEAKSERIEGAEVRTFRAHAVAPLVPEPYMTPASDSLWTATVSTVRDWDAYARWELSLLTDAFSPSPALDTLAQKLTARAATPRDKIDRLTAYVAQEIRYQQEYEDTIAGVKPHSANIVLERGYGDCKDKAVLLIRLARALGIEVRFTVLRTTPQGALLKEIPNQQFNHAIAFVPRQPGIDEPLFVDTTTNGLDLGNLRTDDQGATGLVMNTQTGAYEFLPIPYQPPELESVKHVVSVDLKDLGKAHATDKIEVRGAPAAGLRVALRSGEGARKVYQGLSESVFSGTTLAGGKADHDQDITRPLSIELDIDMSNAVLSDGAAARLNVPLLFPLSQRATLSARRLPLSLPRGVLTFEMEVALPPGHSASHVPPDVSVEHACFSIQRRASASAGKVTVRESYRNSCARVEPGDYVGFRAAVQKAVAFAQDSIAFGPTKKGEGGAKKAPR